MSSSGSVQGRSARESWQSAVARVKGILGKEGIADGWVQVDAAAGPSACWRAREMGRDVPATELGFRSAALGAGRNSPFGRSALAQFLLWVGSSIGLALLNPRRLDS